MAQEYQPRRFFRRAPNRLLQRYFAERKVLADVDFGALTETQVEPIYEAWLKLPEEVRTEVEQDFQEIDDLSTEGGIKSHPGRSTLARRRPGRAVLRPQGLP